MPGALQSQLSAAWIGPTAKYAGLLITASLSGGASWESAAFRWGCLPIFASGLLILAARNVDPKVTRAD